MAHIPQRSPISILSAHRWEYDVFLSFRGEDTRKTFTDHLFHELQRKQIKVFRDVEVKKGSDFTSMLPTAIEESRFVIIVLSPNYASSTWCLRELSKAFKCKKEGKKIQRIIPIFYNVKPSDVRKQKGTFDEAFKKHEKNLIENISLQEWRNSLREVSHLSGWNSEQYGGYEGLLTKEIAESVSIELFCACCTLRIDDEELYFNCMDAVWHPKCFLCKACHLPFIDDKFWDCGNHPYHKECYMISSGIGIATGDSDDNETTFGFTYSVPLPVPPPVSLVDSSASGRGSIFSSFKGEIFTATNNFISRTKMAVHPSINRWKPPNHSQVKLNFDGSLTSFYNSIEAVAGFIEQNHLGDPVLAMSEKLGNMEILLAEACALRDVLQIIDSNLHPHVTIEGDLKTLIDALNGMFEVPWRIKYLVADIHHLKSRFQTFSFTHIWREANFVADKLADLGHIHPSTTIWHHSLPSAAVPAHMFDGFGSSKVRNWQNS